MDVATYQFGAIPGQLLDYVKDKNKSAKCYFRYFLARTQKMFQYKNLPDTIEADVLERYLQINGVACITEYKDKLYVFAGNLGDKQDVYYRPTKFIVSNPHISQEGFFKEVTVLGDEAHDGVLMRNDTEWIGLTPLFARYSVMLAENLLTLRSADIMLRVMALLSAPTDSIRKSAMDYLQKLEKGEFGVIGDDAFTEGIKMQSPPSNNGSYLTQFIELQQYIKGSFFNELGLRANYNMKREAIGTGESTLDQDVIMPLVDNMLTTRRQDLEKVNNLYNLDISVDFSSAWLQNQIEEIAILTSQLGETTNGNGSANQPTDFSDGQSDEDNTEHEEADTQSSDTDRVDEQTTGRAVQDNQDVDGPSQLDESSDSEDSSSSADSAINDLTQDPVLTGMKELVTDVASQLGEVEEPQEDDANLDQVGSTSVEKGEEDNVDETSEGS